MTHSLIQLTEDQFDARYRLRTNHLNPHASWAFGDGTGCLFETYGEELDFVRSQDPQTIWTFVDGDDGDQYVMSGYHLVNRIGYLLSIEPVPEGTESLFHKGVWAIEWGMEHKPYPSDLTDDQWATLQPLIPRTRPGGRPRKTDMRAVVNALFYVSRQGCTWRALPHDFPPWKTVYNYFQWFQWDGTWQRLVDALRERVREKAGRQKTPSACAIDSQSVKTAEGGREIGNDGGKKVHGRKRHILVDTLGLLIAVVVTAANVDDGRAAQDVFAQARGRDFPRLEVVFADNKYHNYALYDWLRLHRRPYRLEVVSRPPGERKFKPLKIRWVVERTFAWLGRYRRLSKDYEHLPESSQAMVQLGAIHHMLRRLKPKRKAWSQRFRFKGHRPKSAA